MIETVKEWWFSPDDETPVYCKGDRLRVEYILLDNRELNALTADDLEDINWSEDGVQATFLDSNHGVSSLGLLFSDFVLVDEGVTTEGAENVEPTA